MFCAACERAATTEAKPVVLDPCSLVTRTDASALFGHSASQKPAGDGACEWEINVSDRSASSLRLQIQMQKKDAPLIIVTKSEIMINGQQYGEPTKAEPLPIGEYGVIELSGSLVRLHWIHGDKLLELTLASKGPSTFTAVSKTEQMKRLAQKVDRSL